MVCEQEKVNPRAKLFLWACWGRAPFLVFFLFSATLYGTAGSSGPCEGRLYVWEFIPWKPLHYFQIVFPNLKLVESPGTVKEEFTVCLERILQSFS